MEVVISAVPMGSFGHTVAAKKMTILDKQYIMIFKKGKSSRHTHT